MSIEDRAATALSNGICSTDREAVAYLLEMELITQPREREVHGEQVVYFDLTELGNQYQKELFEMT